LPDLEVTFTNESVGYGLSYVTGISATGWGPAPKPTPPTPIPNPGDYLVTLDGHQWCEPDYYSRPEHRRGHRRTATITAVTDVPDDQGGWVYVRFPS
jgi:hypothetical protein